MKNWKWRKLEMWRIGDVPNSRIGELVNWRIGDLEFWLKPFWLKSVFLWVCVFVSRLMGRRGWSSFPVSEGWVQVVRGPRPKSVQWPRASKDGKPQPRAPGTTPQQGPLAPATDQRTRSSVQAQSRTRGGPCRCSGRCPEVGGGDRSPWRGQCARERSSRCVASRKIQDQSASSLRASGSVQDLCRKGQETGPASAGSDGQGSRAENRARRRGRRRGAQVDTSPGRSRDSRARFPFLR